ncbi:MAG TPA: 6-bladed beta-propeller [Chitinophagaceae bacterium]|nr:6-bladed beta-propeller [Chitinophagaceae bacterium]
MRFLTFSLMIMLFCGCYSQRGKSSFPGPPSNLEITRQRFLGENLADSMMIYTPSALQTDSEGNVYVFDKGQMNIKVFDEDGNPLQIIGNRGRGPGEFISNSGFFVYRDSLYVFDQKLQRLNVFSTEGNPETTYSLKVAAPLVLKPVGEDHHLGIYTGYIGPESRLNINYAREHASDFSTEGDAFLQLTRLIPELEGVNDLLGLNLGDVLITEMNKFIYVLFFYDGELYQFEKENERWQHTNTYKGYIERNPYSQLKNSSGRHPDMTLSSVKYNNPLEYVVHNQSRGLVKYKDKIYHFTQCEFNDGKEERIFGVEIFNKKMQPLGYVPFETIPIANEIGNTIGWHAEGIDKEGNVYIRERNGEISNIWLLKFNWQEI